MPWHCGDNTYRIQGDLSRLRFVADVQEQWDRLDDRWKSLCKKQQQEPYVYHPDSIDEIQEEAAFLFEEFKKLAEIKKRGRQNYELSGSIPFVPPDVPDYY